MAQTVIYYYVLNPYSATIMLLQIISGLGEYCWSSICPLFHNRKA